MLDIRETKRLDLNYRYLHGDLYQLMENAGTAVAEAITEKYGNNRKILVICGNGNNGGDGFVAARILSSGNKVDVYPLYAESSLKTREAKKAFRNFRGSMVGPDIPDISQYDIVVDAMLGSGIAGVPRKPVSDVIHAINGSESHIVSIDIPSGMGSPIAVSPEMTVTLTDIKDGMNKTNSGEIVIRSIGIPEAAFRNSGPGDFLYLRTPEAGSHKGMNGKVAIIAGHTYYGSAVISALGSIKSGCDLVRVYTSPENLQVISGYDPQIITMASKNLTMEEISKSDSILIGSGCGPVNLDMELDSISGFKGSIVVDADGLRMIDRIIDSCPQARICVTPHAGEFRMISGRPPSVEAAIEYSEKTGTLVLLKGERDIITDGGVYKITEGGNPRMTMGGTGDLLAGLLASLLPRSGSQIAAACMASFVNKKAADICYQEKSFWYDIHDMIRKIPEVFRYYHQY